MPKLKIQNDNPKVPRHVAIIMDGNGRWAKEHGLSRVEGHKEGAKRVKDVMDAARECGVKYVTLYAFSSENWSRPKAEVSALMKLLEHSLKSYAKDFLKNKIRFRTIGDISKLPEKTVTLIEKLKEETKDFNEHCLVLALNYGSRDELLRAVSKIARDAKQGIFSPEHIGWDDVSEYLDTADIPDPDLMVRTSGEMRISNYLLLQSAYAELYFTQVNWPDFGRDEFMRAIGDFERRERRYGLTGEQIK